MERVLFIGGKHKLTGEGQLAMVNETLMSLQTAEPGVGSILIDISSSLDFLTALFSTVDIHFCFNKIFIEK